MISPEYILDLAAEGAVGLNTGEYDYAKRPLLTALNAAEASGRLLTAAAIAAQLFRCDMLSRGACERLASARSALRLPTVFERAHLLELDRIRAEWLPITVAPSGRATRSLRFATGEKGALCWNRGAIELTSLAIPRKGLIEVRPIVTAPRLSELMTLACLSVLVPWPSKDAFDDPGVELECDAWLVRFVDSGREELLRGYGNF